MNQKISSSNTNVNKTIKSEQFNQIVEAILEGKYSWACVLLLRFAGYNALHYIPYRTYNRLTKEHEQIGKPIRSQTNSSNSVNECFAGKSNSKI